MIRDPGAWEDWEQKEKKKPVDIKQNFLLMEAMLEEAQALRAFSQDNPLAGLDIKIHLAKVINVSKAA